MWAEERLSAWNCGSDVLLVRSFVRSFVARLLLPVFPSPATRRSAERVECTNPRVARVVRTSSHHDGNGCGVLVSGDEWGRGKQGSVGQDNTIRPLPTHI